MKLRDVAKSLGLDVGCQSADCLWGYAGGMATAGGCRCGLGPKKDGAGAYHELLEITRVAQHLAAEVERMKATWKALSDAARCEDLRPEHHGEAVLRYINDTMGQAAKVFEENRTLHAEIERMRPVVGAAQRWRRTVGAVGPLTDAINAYEKEPTDA